MGLREDALAAAQAERVARRNAARVTLAAVLEGADVSAATVAHEESGVVVFADDGVHLAVRGDDVALVRNNDGWTRVGDVTSLADLGILLSRQAL